ncbi:hypothetical protein BLS_007763 [Venturia inaequalis]|uniref:Major facilitator superfamily (MFS) profile domain-containing protein n=1 Tax=Venturia inaequalis TaxID=5025 RepID=A0A8H3U8U3_VENIN|nr:hypothetical protein BLS_007763 [Venturia inaequalis]
MAESESKATGRPISSPRRSLEESKSKASTLALSHEPSAMEKVEQPTGHPATTTESELNNTEVVDKKDQSAESREVAPEGEESEDEIQYPKGLKLTLITIALCLSVFCMALDNTIIATAIPKISDAFNSLDDVGWYASAYLLTTCTFQLFFGKLYTFYSIKWVYLTAIFIFEVGSLICGAAPNSTALIVGRAIAGLGSAGIFSGAILIVANSVPLPQRPTYTGVTGAMYGVASVAGPLMGGAFTDKLTWRWCFYINLPFGFVTAVFIIIFFSSPKSAKKSSAVGWKAQAAQMDPFGTVIFILGIVCLLLALQWGGTKYAWGNGRIIALFVLFAVLISVFVALQIYLQETATVPPRVFMDRNVWGSALFGACLGGSFFVLVYYIPIWFQAIKGASAVKSGIMNLPMILGLVIISVVAGIGVSAVGYYTPFIYAAVVLMAIGAGLLTTFKPNTGHAKWIGYQFIFGAGVGAGMQQTLIAAQTALSSEDIPIGTAIMMFAQTLGGALMVSVGQNVFQNQLLKNLSNVLPASLDANKIIANGATQFQKAIPKEYLAKALLAYNDALTQTWYVAVALAAMSGIGAAFIQWKSVKGKNIEMGGMA